MEQLVAKHVPKFEQLRPKIGWISAEQIKATLAATTQFGRTVV